jgi:hypothetical protein
MAVMPMNQKTKASDPPACTNLVLALYSSAAEQGQPNGATSTRGRLTPTTTENQSCRSRERLRCNGPTPSGNLSRLSNCEQNARPSASNANGRRLPVRRNQYLREPGCTQAKPFVRRLLLSCSLQIRAKLKTRPAQQRKFEKHSHEQNPPNEICSV